MIYLYSILACMCVAALFVNEKQHAMVVKEWTIAHRLNEFKEGFHFGLVGGAALTGAIFSVIGVLSEALH